MLIFAIIIAIFIVASLKWAEKTFAFYCAFKILAVGAMCVRYEPPSLSVETALNLWFIFLFFYKGYFKNLRSKLQGFPLKSYFWLTAISIAISFVISINPFTSNITKIVVVIAEQFMMPIMFYLMMCRHESFVKEFIYCLVIVLLLAGVYELVEYALGINPFFTYLMLNVDEDYLLGKFYLGGERLGMLRVQSLFVSPNNLIYGAFIMSMVAVFNLSHKYKEKIKFSLSLTFFTLLLILLTNSRTVLIASVVILFPLFIPSRKNIKTIVVGLVIVLFAAPFLYKYVDNFTSSFSVSGKSDIEGSSVTMRSEQLAASFQIFWESPLIGHGYDATDYYIEEKGWRDELRGGESIWFRLLIDRGLLGIIAYLFLFFEAARRCKFLRNIYFSSFMIGYLLANTASSLPGFALSFLYMGIMTMDYLINSGPTRRIIN